MGRYLENALTKDEELLHEARISGWALLHFTVPGGLLLVASAWLAYASETTLAGIGGMVGLLGGGYLLLRALVQYMSTEMAVTNKRVISKVGLVRRSTVEIALSKVEGIQVHQSIIGRVFGYGTVIVAGTGTSHAPVAGISEPMTFRNAYLEAEARRT